MSLLVLPDISIKNIQNYINIFFNITDEHVQKLYDLDWTTYKFFVESVTFEYVVKDPYPIIHCSTKYALPVGLDPNEDKNTKHQKTEIEVLNTTLFLDIYKQHISDIYSHMNNLHKTAPILLDKDIYIDKDSQERKVLIGQNKYMYAYHLAKTYIFHISMYIPFKFYTSYGIDLDKVKIHKPKHMYKFLDTTVKHMKELNDMEQMYTIQPSIEGIVNIDKTLYDTSCIPSIYLSRTFMPREVRSEDVKKVNKQTVNLFKTLEKTTSKLFKIFRKS